MTKYRAIRTQDPDTGIWFDSRAEWIRYRQLKLLELGGEITTLRCHPKFELLPKLRKLRAVVYVADFGYREPGRGVLPVVEDVKGVRTAVWRLKWNMVQRTFPGIEWRIVEAKDMYRG